MFRSIGSDERSYHIFDHVLDEIRYQIEKVLINKSANSAKVQDCKLLLKKKHIGINNPAVFCEDLQMNSFKVLLVVISYIL